MTPEELQIQANKIISFNEFTSKKVIALKKLISSKLGLVFLISTICLVTFTFILEVGSMLIINGINATNLIDSLFSSAIDIGLPIYFIVLAFIINKLTKSKENEVVPFDSLMPNPQTKKKGFLNRLFSFTRIIFIYFIILGIFSILSSISSINIELVLDVYEEMLGAPLTPQDIIEFKMLGLNSLINGVFYILVGVALNKSSKVFFKQIIFEDDDRYIDFIILSIFLFIFGAIYLVGAIIGTSGIMNPMYKVSIMKSINTSFSLIDVFGLLQNISLVFTLIYLGILTLKVRKLLIESKGQDLSKENSRPIYTVNIDNLD